MYDKALHLGSMSARMLKYPRNDSQQAWEHKIGIIKSQLGRIYCKSDHEDKFIRDAMRMILQVRWNGVSTKGIHKSLKTWSPRKTIHLPWRATSWTIKKLQFSLEESDKIMRNIRKGWRQKIAAGVTNGQMERHIQKITNAAKTMQMEAFI